MARLAFTLVVLGADRTATVRTWTFRQIEWSPSIAELAQPVLVAAMILVLAVAVGRWWHHPAAGFLVPFVLFMSPVMWFAPPIVEAGMVEMDGGLVDVPASAVGWHLLYLAGGVVLFVALALVRSDRRTPVGIAAGIDIAAMAAGFALGPLPL